MKIKDFRKEIQKIGEWENATWLGEGDSIPVPFLMEKPEECAKHRQNEQIEQNGVKPAKTQH